MAGKTQTEAQLASAEKQRQEWAAFKAWREAGSPATPETPAAPAAEGLLHDPELDPDGSRAAAVVEASRQGHLTRLDKMLLEEPETISEVTDALNSADPAIAEAARRNFEEAGQRTVTTHVSQREAVVYNKRGIAKRVPRGSFLAQLREPDRNGKQAWFEECPRCHGLHPQTETDPNACPSRTGDAVVLIVACPARSDCAWRGWVFPEEAMLINESVAGSTQLFPMTTDNLVASGRALAIDHAWAKHPSESRGRGNLGVDPYRAERQVAAA